MDKIIEQNRWLVITDQGNYEFVSKALAEAFRKKYNHTAAQVIKVRKQLPVWGQMPSR